MKLKLIVPPATEPINLIEAKTHMRVDCDSDDDYIISLITAAREWCETYQNRAYIAQTWEVALDEFLNKIELPKPPLQSVTSIKYYNANEEETTISTDDYYVDTYSQKGIISLKHNKQWPKIRLRPVNGVIIRYVAGYESVEDVPKKVKQAILMLISHWYENREPVTTLRISDEIEFTLRAILNQDKIYVV